MFQKLLTAVLAYVTAAYSKLEWACAFTLALLDEKTRKYEMKLWGESRAANYTAKARRRAALGELGIFMVLVFGAVALVVVAIVLLFGMQISGEFAEGINVDNAYSDEANQTVNSTGAAFQLFGTSVLVIPAAAVLAVLIGGLIGAVAMVGGGGIPGAPMSGGGGGR